MTPIGPIIEKPFGHDYKSADRLQSVRAMAYTKTSISH